MISGVHFKKNIGTKALPRKRLCWVLMTMPPVLQYSVYKLLYVGTNRKGWEKVLLLIFFRYGEEIARVAYCKTVASAALQ